jgi:hypothetical protein
MNPIVVILASKAQLEALVPTPMMPKQMGEGIVGKHAIELFAKAIVADCIVEVKKVVAADIADTIEQKINEHFGF